MTFRTRLRRIPEITVLDELQTFVGNKHQTLDLDCCDHWQPGILVWVVGDRSAETFKPLWSVVKCWQSFGMSPMATVYPKFIEDASHPFIRRT